ncbi:MAG: acetyl-CoA carboxylase biotin carboxyl carrier protein [Gemmatimonadaceae bacterium]|nr:acetyl-CoA carboxylase biotin carboxyl carrier protein [Gloeobacterales cyanobacterium ES-bin-141]
MNIDLAEIRELITILNQTDVTELTIEAEGFRLSIRKESGKPVALTTTTVLATPPEPPAEPSPPPAPPVVPRNTVDVVAPMVGTFYLAPAPNTPNFVEPGDTVRVGQSVCIIEAMKLMNVIESEVGGKVVEILVQNAEPVEFGQVLMRLEPQ